MCDQKKDSSEDKWLTILVLGLVVCFSSCTAIQSFAPPPSYWWKCEGKPQ